jgi:hypothetical protein
MCAHVSAAFPAPTEGAEDAEDAEDAEVVELGLAKLETPSRVETTRWRSRPHGLG